jgi:flagella basal body P-ring formation protein FlgA
MRPFLPALALALAVATPAAAATLRPLTTLDSPLVRLADLFDDAGPLAQRVLGPGPQPGGRIVVEAPQLAAIARQFGVDWSPASPADRAVLDRPGRLLPQQDLLAGLRQALIGVGAPADGAISLAGYQAPMVPLTGPVRVSVEQLDYDAASGRFGAMVLVSCPGMDTLRQRLAGDIESLMTLPVLVERLPAGHVLTAADLRSARVRASLVHADTLRGAAEAVGKALRHFTPAGQPLTTGDLTAPLVVQRNARVLMRLTVPGLAVTGQGLALESGAIGQSIRVLNPVSQAIIAAEVIGPDVVRVSPGSVPLTPAGGMARVALR